MSKSEPARPAISEYTQPIPGFYVMHTHPDGMTHQHRPDNTTPGHVHTGLPTIGPIGVDSYGLEE